jgi:phosphoenolpyruvate carboxykinase (ATP)
MKKFANTFVPSVTELPYSAPASSRIYRSIPSFFMVNAPVLQPETDSRPASAAELLEKALLRGEGVLTDTGALRVMTGRFTGRSPKDRFWVSDAFTQDRIAWGDVNQAIRPEQAEGLFRKMEAYLKGREVFVRNARACADDDYRLDVRVVTTLAWQSLFVSHLFIETDNTAPEWTIYSIPEFEADPATDGTRQGNFTVIDVARKRILIGGTGYAGEIKKAVFSVLNLLLPVERGVLPMHCSVNVGKQGDTAVFFGLSGTGKTTLSADPDRRLVGDDEHGWSDTGVFNFEGGCYAKAIGLSVEKEPQIFAAVRDGAVLENTPFIEGTRTPDYASDAITENTRAAYPLTYIQGALLPSVAGIPENIFFLTADAFGVLPPVSRLTPGQAVYHFLSGFTSKLAGTEVGVTEPCSTFSACFGAAFLPLDPVVYAEMLGEKIRKYNVSVWLVNTGWTGGGYGTGSRIPLRYTRAMISAALEGRLTVFEPDEVFGVARAVHCPGVPDELLSPRLTWSSAGEYLLQANKLAVTFQKNFNRFEGRVSADVLIGRPEPVYEG